MENNVRHIEMTLGTFDGSSINIFELEQLQQALYFYSLF